MNPHVVFCYLSSTKHPAADIVVELFREFIRLGPLRRRLVGVHFPGVRAHSGCGLYSGTERHITGGKQRNEAKCRWSWRAAGLGYAVLLDLLPKHCAPHFLFAPLQLVVAVPTGILCDAHRRDRILRVAALLGLVAGFVQAAAMLSSTIHLGYLAVAATLLGCYRGMYSVALESIFADSVEAGRRSVGVVFGVG